MAYNAIASGSAILTPNADGLTAGLAKAGKDIDGWDKSVGSNFGKSFGGAARARGSVPPSWASRRRRADCSPGSGSPSGARSVRAVSGALGSAKGLVDGLIGTLTDASGQGAMAQALGLTAEQFTGMAGVAKSVGGDTREFIESIVTMGKLGSDAAAGVGEIAGPAFEKLGVSAQAFIKLRPDEPFFSMFEALNKLGPGLEQTRLLMAAFGEDVGKYLLPLLGKAPDERRAMASSLAVTSAEMQKATAASGAFKKLETVGDKLWRGLAVAAAPGLEMLANFGAEALKAAQPMFDLISAGADRVWHSVRSLFDGMSDVASRLWARVQPQVQPIFDWLERAWETTKWVAGIAWDGIVSLVVPAVEKIVDWIADAVDAVSGWGKEVVGLTGDWAKAENFIVKAFRTIGTVGAATWDTLRVGAGFLAIGIAKVIEYLGKLGSQYLFVVKGMVGVAAKFGIMNESLKGLEKFSEQWDKMSKDVAKDIQNWGEEMVKSGGKTVKQFNDWLNCNLPRVGRGAGRLGGMFEGLDGGALGGADETPSSWKLSAALEEGTQEAYALVLKN